MSDTDKSSSATVAQDRLAEGDPATLKAVGERMDELAFLTDRNVGWDEIYRTLRRELGGALSRRQT